MIDLSLSLLLLGEFGLTFDFDVSETFPSSSLDSSPPLFFLQRGRGASVSGTLSAQSSAAKFLCAIWAESPAFASLTEAGAEISTPFSAGTTAAGWLSST